MSDRIKLGRITRATFGLGGYQDVQMGLHLTFGADGWGCGESDAFWSMAPSPGAEWDLDKQTDRFGEVVRRTAKLLNDAKKSDVAELVGTPVELTFDSLKLSSWRVLTEVIG